MSLRPQPATRLIAEGEPVEPYIATPGEGPAPASDASVAAPARVPSFDLASYLRELGMLCTDARAAFALCDASWLIEAAADPESVLKTLDLMRLPEPYATRVREWLGDLAPLPDEHAARPQSVAGEVPSSPATTAPVAPREVEDARGPGAIFYGRS